MTLDKTSVGISNRATLILTLVIASLVTAIGIAGVFFKETYAKEAESWALQAMGQDIANLVSVPIFVAAGVLTARGSVKGLAVWLGVLLFLLYAFVIYAFDVQYNSLFLAYVAVLGLSFFAFFGKMISLDFERLRQNFAGSRKTKHVSVLLMIIAVLFFVQWLSQDIPAVLSNEAPADVREIGIPTNPVHVLDLGLFLPAMVISSVLMWKKNVIGYLFAAPLLIFAILTGAGILFANALMRLGGTEVSVVPDAVIGSICAVSFVLSWLYLREVRNEPKSVDSNTIDRQGDSAAA